MSSNSSSLEAFECECSERKIYRLKFEDRTSGNYIVNYCENCYDLDDKKFLIGMEKIEDGLY